MALEEIELEGQSFFVPAIRTDAPTHRCICVIVELTDDEYENRCGEDELPPDVPFCDKCSDRHPHLQSDETVAVTVWRRPMKEQ